MDALLNGKPLGNGNGELVDQGVAAYHDAMDKLAQGDAKPLGEMVANTLRTMSWQASQETTLSPRNVLIGRLMGNAAQLAARKGVELPMDEDEMSNAYGAVTLAEVAQKYHAARQQLGNDPAKITSPDGRAAVSDLLMGNAVEKMIQQDKRLGQTITNTQSIMGQGLWSLENLRVYAADSATRRGIQETDVQRVLEKPNSTRALSIGQSMVNEIVKASQEDYAASQEVAQKQLEQEQLEQTTQMNPMQMTG